MAAKGGSKAFVWFLKCSFILCTSLYAILAITGFTMFGEDTASQITLNLPKQYFASKLATWTTVSNHLRSNLWYVDNHLVLWSSYDCRVLQFHEPKLFLDIRYQIPKPQTLDLLNISSVSISLLCWQRINWMEIVQVVNPFTKYPFKDLKYSQCFLVGFPPLCYVKA